jgi:hypothetical protein
MRRVTPVSPQTSASGNALAGEEEGNDEQAQGTGTDGTGSRDGRYRGTRRRTARVRGNTPKTKAGTYALFPLFTRGDDEDWVTR